MNKVTIIMKSPDAIDYAREDVDEKDLDKFDELCSRFFLYGEYLDLEMDLEKETLTIKGVN